MKSVFPTTGTEEDWNAAYFRLEDYLRALHLVNKVHQSQIILQLLEVAAEKHARDPTRSPTELLLEEADSALEQWFACMLPEEKRALVMGLVALRIADGAEKWPMFFLEDDVPAEFREAMRENDTRAGPDLQISSMVPRPIDAPLIENLFNDSTAETQRGAVLMACIGVTAVIALLVFFFSR